MHEAGKGDGRRPMAISDQQYAQRWDLIFGKDKHEKADTGSTEENQQRVGLEGSAELHGERHVAQEVGERNTGPQGQ